MTAIVVNIPLRTYSLANQREHWTVRHRRAKRERTKAWVHCRQAGVWPSKRPAQIVVTLTRHAPCKLDSDNVCGALKSTRDGVADALGIDDGSELVEWRYEQEKAKGYSVTIRIERAAVRAVKGWAG